MPGNAYVNRIATAVPDHEVHRFFLRFAASLLDGHPQRRSVFERMSDMAGIERRYSCFAPADDPDGDLIDREGTSARGSFAGTGKRMQMFETAAPGLAQKAIDRLLAGEDRSRITHLIVTCCTGFSAPGIDLDLLERCGLPISVERTMIGFMGCYAAINALKLARHIVRSEDEARVLVVNIELCTLHLRETEELEKLLAFCLWGDGCAASLVTCRAARHPARQLPRHRCRGASRTDELAHSRRRFPNGAFRPGACGDPRDLAYRSPRRYWVAVPSRMSICGPCIPAVDRFSTPSNGRSVCARPRSPHRATCSGSSATCRRPR